MAVSSFTVGTRLKTALLWASSAMETVTAAIALMRMTFTVEMVCKFTVL